MGKPTNPWSIKLTSDIFIFLCSHWKYVDSQLSCHRESRGIFAEALGPCAGGPAFKGRDPAVPSESVPSP